MVARHARTLANGAGPRNAAMCVVAPSHVGEYHVLFWSGKSINLRKSVPFIVLIALVLAFALISSYPPGILFALFLAYAGSGYIVAALRWRRRRSHRAEPASPASPTHTEQAGDTAAAPVEGASSDPGSKP